jgi:GT2 family glycosyltransferase
MPTAYTAVWTAGSGHYNDPVTRFSMRVSIVIVNWNSGALLSQCLQSIESFGGDLVARVIVVDNASTDGSIAMAERLKSQRIEIIHNNDNIGFARACNAGARGVSSEFVLFLNPDTRLMKSALANAVRAMDERIRSGVGIVGTQLIDEFGAISRCCARFPGPRHFVIHGFGVDRIFPAAGFLMGDWDHSRSREVDHVIGAFFLVRMAVFNQLAGFDERFFVYLEDLDFSQRAARSGWKSWYEASAKVFHVGGGTSRQAKPQRLFYSLRSRILYSRKHFSSLGHLAVAITTLFIEPCSRLLAAAARRDVPMAIETCLGFRRLWRWAFSGSHRIWSFTDS